MEIKRQCEECSKEFMIEESYPRKLCMEDNLKLAGNYNVPLQKRFIKKQ